MLGMILKYIRLGVLYTIVTIRHIILNVLVRIPFVKPWTDAFIEDNLAPAFYKEKFPWRNWVDTYYSFAAYTHILRIVRGDIWKSIYCGGKAHNSELVNIDGKPCHLLDFQRPGRPLVVNFGSST